MYFMQSSNRKQYRRRQASFTRALPFVLYANIKVVTESNIGREWHPSLEPYSVSFIRGFLLQ